MRRIVGGIFQSLDGVVQAPGGPTEDWTGGFRYGGWMAPVSDDAVGAAVGSLLGGDYALLLGRRTYEIFAAYWPDQDEAGPAGDIARPFNRAAKYVLTRDAELSLTWANSHRLADIDAVAALKGGDGPDLIVQGSSTLYPQLLSAGLLDRLTIITLPVVLGQGRRLFGAGTPARTLRMIEHVVSPGGVVIAQYEPAGPVEIGSFGAPADNPREAARQARMQTEG